jgi:hypothetical protein
MDLVDLRARSTFLVDLEFAELARLAEKIGSGAVILGSRATWSSAKHPLNTVFFLVGMLVYCKMESASKIV